jgi:hypothetical protein
MSVRCCLMFDVAVESAVAKTAVPPHLPRRRPDAPSSSAPERRQRQWRAPSKHAGRRTGRSTVLSSPVMAMASGRSPASRWSRPVTQCPDAAGEAAAAHILDLVRGLGTDDLVLCLISGGGSSLLSLPARGSVSDLAGADCGLNKSRALRLSFGWSRVHVIIPFEIIRNGGAKVRSFFTTGSQQ